MSACIFILNDEIACLTLNPVQLQLADCQGKSKKMPQILPSQSQQGKSTFTEQEIPGKSLDILFCHSSIMKCHMDLYLENVQNIQIDFYL